MEVGGSEELWLPARSGLRCYPSTRSWSTIGRNCGSSSQPLWSPSSSEANRQTAMASRRPPAAVHDAPDEGATTHGSPARRDRRNCDVRSMMFVGGPPLAFDFGEAGSCKSLGYLVNGPAIGGNDFVVESRHLGTVEEAQHQHSRRGHGSLELSEPAVRGDPAAPDRSTSTRPGGRQRSGRQHRCSRSTRTRTCRSDRPPEHDR